MLHLNVKSNILALIGLLHEKVIGLKHLCYLSTQSAVKKSKTNLSHRLSHTLNGVLYLLE